MKTVENLITCYKYLNILRTSPLLIQLSKLQYKNIYTNSITENNRLQQINKWNNNNNLLCILKNQNIRNKYTKGSKKEEDSDSDDEHSDNFKDEKDSKIVRTKVNSLRADLILKAGLGIARNKVEAIFYESKIRVNGKKLPKKSVQLEVGDEIDVIKGFSNVNPSHLIVARVIILSAIVKEENIFVNLRRFKSLTIENYETLNVFKSSEPE